MTETITSPQNPRLKQLRKLAERKQRDRESLFAAEGEDLLAEALRAGRVPETVFYEDDGGFEPADLPGNVEALSVSRQALDAASTLGSGSRVIGVWRQSWAEPDAKLIDPKLPLVYLHQPSDPGNVGTVIRAAHALGAAGVVLGGDCADPHGPKAVRASMGAVFAVPLLRVELDRLGAALPQRTTIALAAGEGRELGKAACVTAPVFVLGSEREGLPDRIRSSCAEIAHIPLQSGGAESLNLAMAATLCLYENALHRLAATAEESKT